MSKTWEKIATSTASNGAGSVSLSGISSSYTDLKVIGKWAQNATNYNLQFRVNNDTTTNYNWRMMTVGGSNNATSTYAIDSNNVNFTDTLGGIAVTSIFATFELDIFDYANTNIFKSFIGKTGVANQNQGRFGSFTGGLWRDTSAITSLQFIMLSSGFTGGSIFSVYGLKRE